MADLEEKVSNLESGQIKAEAVLQTIIKSLEKIDKNLESLTKIQIDMARDREYFSGRAKECEDNIARAHERITKLENSQIWLVRSVITAIITLVLYSLGITLK